MKYLFFLLVSGLFMVACQSNDAASDSPATTSAVANAADANTVAPSHPDPNPNYPNAETEEVRITPQGREHDIDGRILDQPQVKEAMKKLKPQAHNSSADGEPILIRKVNMSFPVNAMMVQKGQLVHKEKCAGCHTLDTQKTALKSLAGITRRRTPEWIMNMITGVSTTLESSAAAQQKLEACPSRQTATRLNIEQARDYLEMLRQVDDK